MKGFPSKSQMQRYAMRKAKYQWKRETGFYDHRPSTTNSPLPRPADVQGSGFSAALGILFLVGLIGGIIAGLIFHTWVTLAIIGITVTVLVGIFYPPVLLIAVGILLLIVMSFIMT